MAATRFGMLPTRGTSCDRREGAFRSRAYTRGSTDRRCAVASVKWASAERCEGWVWRDLLRSHRVIGFGDQKYSQMSKLFLLLPLFLGLARSDGFLERCKFVQGFTELSRTLQNDPGKCRMLQSNAGANRILQSNPRCSKGLQDRTRKSRAFQENAEICRNVQGA